MKEGDSPEVPRRRGALRLRRDLEDPVDQAGAAPRNLLELPPVLHGQAEAARYRRPRRALHQEVRRADVGKPQDRREGDQGQEDDDHRGPLSRFDAGVQQRPGFAPPSFVRDAQDDAGPPGRSTAAVRSLPPRGCRARTSSPARDRARGARDESRAPRPLRGRSAAGSRASRSDPASRRPPPRADGRAGDASASARNASMRIGS